MDEARVKFYVRADAWAAWEALDWPTDSLALAFAELGDERLVAAYVLEALADQEEERAAQGGPQVKRLKDGAEELEYFQGQAAENLRAVQWRKRALALRGSLTQGGRAGQRPRSTVYQPELDA